MDNNQRNQGRKNSSLWKADGPGFSSQSDDWATPPHVFAELAREFSFTLDASASAANAKCCRFFTVDDDGLSKAWAPETVWVNPPYARGITGLWLEKAADEAESGATVVALVPARTDTRWWHDHVMARAAEVRLVRGRLRFGNGRAPAPFPSAVVVYRPNPAPLTVTVWTPAVPR